MKNACKTYLIIFAIFVVIAIIIVLVMIFHPWKPKKYDRKPAFKSSCKQFLNLEKIRCLDKLDNVTMARIWSGRTVSPGQLPHVALIQSHNVISNKKKKRFCAGSLISKYFVLTVAHCIDKVPKYGATIVLGMVDIFADVGCREDYKNEAVYFYNSKSSLTRLHDIALIKLDREVVYDFYIRPICLNTKLNIELNGLSVAGWGKYESNNYSRILRCANLVSMPISECSQKFPHRFSSTYNLCAGHPSEHKDVCEGDSGGPLQIPSTDNIHSFLQVGISAYGMSCYVPGQTRTVGIYVKVAFYSSWIESVVKSHELDYLA